MNANLKWLIGGALLLATSAATAAQYQVTYSATDPTSYLPTDAPDYPASYRVAGGAAVALPATSTPAGAFQVVANPADLIELCVLSRNGALVTPASCDGNWLVIGTAPVTPPTQPLGLTGFSATIIYLGP